MSLTWSLCSPGPDRSLDFHSNRRVRERQKEKTIKIVLSGYECKNSTEFHRRRQGHCLNYTVCPSFSFHPFCFKIFSRFTFCTFSKLGIVTKFVCFRVCKFYLLRFLLQRNLSHYGNTFCIVKQVVILDLRNLQNKIQQGPFNRSYNERITTKFFNGLWITEFCLTLKCQGLHSSDFTQ